MTCHPLSDIFPRMNDADFKALKADIKRYGVREPIWTYEEQILDGRHRWRACKDLGIECPSEEYAGDDATAFIISLNLRRRHLDTSQRAMVAAKLANLQNGQRKAPRSNDLAQSDAAQLLNVSGPSVRRAAKVHRHGAEELVNAVENGKISVFQASSIAAKDKSVQREIVAIETRNHKPTKAAKDEPAQKPSERQKDLAYNYANDAINCLRKIGKENPLRADAFKTVRKWMKDNA
jgi:ParB-like chromosome segregation protein Spo0J